MSDRYRANIHIGGEITPNQLRKILKAARIDYAVYGDWSGNSITDEDLRNLDSFAGDPWLSFYDPEAPYGHFDAIETVCGKENIPYDLLISGYDYCSSCVEFFRDGHTTNWLSDGDFELVVPLKSVRGARNALRSGDIGLALSLLDDVALPEIPELPPFALSRRKRSDKRK